MTAPNSPTDLNDDSIIDISDQLYKINSSNGLKKYRTGVPYWEHRGVYVYSGLLSNASEEQLNFYKIFKYSFLRGEYFDLEGNINYAFVLYFDLLDEYDRHKDVSRIESQLKILGQCYPRTRSFGISYLMQRMALNGDSEGLEHLIEKGWDDNPEFNSNYEDWGLGAKYKDKLRLSEEEVQLINMLEYPNNSFGRMEYCCLQIIKLHLAVISKLKAVYIREGTTLEAQFKSAAEAVAKKHFRYREGTPRYHYCLETCAPEFYRQIFKHCENAVREHYRLTRKIHPDSRYTGAKDEIESEIISKVTPLLSFLVHTVAPPDNDTEIELNAQNPARWKTQFAELTTAYNGKPNEFVDAVVALAKLNNDIRAYESVFFEAIRFMSEYDRKATLSLYIHYAYRNLGFHNLDHKPLPGSIRKKFFQTEHQFLEFEILIEELDGGSNLEDAFEFLSDIFEVKHRETALDTASTKEEQEVPPHLIEKGWDDNPEFNSNYEACGLGAKYKDKLRLSEEEIQLINMLEHSNKSFGRIEYCCLEMIKLHLAVIAGLKLLYTEEGTTLEAQFRSAAEAVAKKHFRYREGSPVYLCCLETCAPEFYRQIFRHCENAVREHYRLTRKIHAGTRYTGAKDEIESKIISKVTPLLSFLVHTVAPPDNDTEIELNAQNPARWKTQFAELANGYNGKPNEFVDAVVALAKLNNDIRAYESVFFEAIRFMSEYDREATLSLYIHYAYRNLGFHNFDHKPLPGSIRKKFFQTEEQFDDFESILSGLVDDYNVENALRELAELLGVKRRKIALDTASIKEAQQQHAGTVELLNEYLRDEGEEENSPVKSPEIKIAEIKMEITRKREEMASPFVSELSFTPVHTAMLELFAKSNFTVSMNEIEQFAKSKGVFKNHLIESINDTCYDFLDDLLIEEENDYYTINTNYFQRISTR